MKYRIIKVEAGFNGDTVEPVVRIKCARNIKPTKLVEYSVRQNQIEKSYPLEIELSFGGQESVDFFRKYYTRDSPNVEVEVID